MTLETTRSPLDSFHFALGVSRVQAFVDPPSRGLGKGMSIQLTLGQGASALVLGVSCLGVGGYSSLDWIIMAGPDLVCVTRTAVAVSRAIESLTCGVSIIRGLEGELSVRVG